MAPWRALWRSWQRQQPTLGSATRSWLGEEAAEEFNLTEVGAVELVKTRRKKRSTLQVLQDDIEKLEADIVKIEVVVEPLEFEEPTHARVLERIAKKRKTLENKAALLAAKKRQVAVEEEKQATSDQTL